MTPDKLKAAWLKLGMSQADLAKRLRTPYRTYDKWERGQRRIPGILEVTIDLLLKQDREFMARIGSCCVEKAPVNTTVGSP